MTCDPKDKQNTRFWEFKNSADNSDETTLYIYGDIVTYDFGDWNFPDDVVPNKFKDELKAIGDVKTLHVRINSGGGSAFAAMAIMNLLKAHKAKVITYNDGICASAATIIAMAGDKIITALGSVWMIHMPATVLWGAYKPDELEKQIESLNVVAETLADIYHAKTRIDRDELKSMMREETWLTGTEALEKGFADEGTNIEVAASLYTDKQSAFFNGVEVDLRGVRHMDKVNQMIDKRITSADITKMEADLMTLDELKEKFPDVYNAARQDGFQEGVLSERGRIKEIQDISLPVMGELTDKAMFTEPVDGATFAKNLILAQKAKGANYLYSAKQDAQQLNDVPNNPAPDLTQQNTAERQRLLNIGKKAADSAQN